MLLQQQKQALGAAQQAQRPGSTPQKNAQPQIVKGIVIAADLILHRQKAAPHGAQAGGVPQRIQIHGKIAVQHFTAVCSAAAQKAKAPSKPHGCGQIAEQKRQRLFPLTMAHGVFGQHGQCYSKYHGQKIGMNGNGKRIQCPQRPIAETLFMPGANIVIQRRQNEKVRSQSRVVQCAFYHNRAAGKQQAAHNRP